MNGERCRDVNLLFELPVTLGEIAGKPPRLRRHWLEPR